MTGALLVPVCLTEQARPSKRRSFRARVTSLAFKLMLLPGGALVLDTPGMRELQLWGDGDGMHSAFQEIEAAAGSCE